MSLAGLPPEPRKARQLLVDLSVIAKHDAGTGIQRVVRAIHAELAGMAIPGVRVRPVAAGFAHDYRYLPDDWATRAAAADLGSCPRVAVAPGDVFLGLDLASAIMPRHEAQLAAWRAAGAAIHIFLFDMLPLLHGAWFRRPARKHFRRWIRMIERQADQVICQCEEVTRQFARWNRRWWRPRSARVVGAVSIPLSGQIGGSLPSCGLPENAGAVLAWMEHQPTVLMVGTVEPRKGYDQALAAFRLLWQRHGDAAPALLLVGRPGWKTKGLQRLMRQLSSLDGRFYWADDASDEFLDMLYPRATGLLFASRGEGFGLPVVEALDHGLPILVRDLPELRQLLRGRASVFVARRPAQLADAVMDWIDAGFDAPAPADRDIRSWRQVTREIVAAIGFEQVPA